MARAAVGEKDVMIGDLEWVERKVGSLEHQIFEEQRNPNPNLRLRLDPQYFLSCFFSSNESVS